MKSRRFLKKITCAVATLSLVFAAVPAMQADAAQITSRKLTLSSSAVGTVAAGQNVTYTFSFSLPTTGTVVKSVNVDICDSASGTCSPSGTGVPSGLTTTGAAVGTVTNLGSTSGWTGTFSTNGRLRIANSGNATTPSGTTSVSFTGITNPSTVNSSYYARITTYSDAAWTTPVDSGTVAASTANQIQLNASVDETLTFCTGTSGITSSSCAGATGTTVNLGTLSASSAKTGTSQIGVATNAGSGYAVTVNGATLTSGSNTISALATQTASSPGTSQFGANLVANTTPSVGSNVQGAGSGTASSNYGTTNQFRFVTGDTVASAAAATDFNLFTVSYLANISNTTPPGSYSATMTYIATATF